MLLAPADIVTNCLGENSVGKNLFWHWDVCDQTELTVNTMLFYLTQVSIMSNTIISPAIIMSSIARHNTYQRKEGKNK